MAERKLSQYVSAVFWILLQCANTIEYLNGTRRIYTQKEKQEPELMKRLSRLVFLKIQCGAHVQQIL